MEKKTINCNNSNGLFVEYCNLDQNNNTYTFRNKISEIGRYIYIVGVYYDGNKQYLISPTMFPIDQLAYSNPYCISYNDGSTVRYACVSIDKNYKTAISRCILAS